MSAVEAAERLVEEWDERLKRVDENLLALESEPTYQMLAGLSGARASLEGASAARVAPALDALAEVFEQRQRIEEVLERARAVRASMSGLAFWENDAKLRELEELFAGPSIRAGARATPLARRGLLDAPAEDVLVSPEQLLVAMSGAFEKARDAILAVKRAWSEIEPALERMAREMAELRATATRAGAPDVMMAQLDAIESDLDDARARIARDPLGTSGGVEAELAPRMAAAREALSALAAQRERVEGGLRRAAEMRAALGRVHDEARRSAAAAREAFERAAVPDPVAAEWIAGLDAWREKLVSTAAARRWSSAVVGLERWAEACATYTEADRAVVAACAVLAGRNSELQGRLSARRAQLDALAARGAPRDAHAEELEAAAKRALAARPLSLDGAQSAVEAFERAVVALARRT